MASQPDSVPGSDVVMGGEPDALLPGLFVASVTPHEAMYCVYWAYPPAAVVMEPETAVLAQVVDAQT